MSMPAIRIVLVEPRGAANIGAVCRVMKNLGLRELVLVRPGVALDDEAAVAFAARAGDVLERARVVDTLADALADCERTYATTAKLGLYRRQAAITPAEAAAEIVDRASAGPIAVAFGRERYGLLLPELLSFDRIVTIPADAEYPALNLAASVTIVAYELHRAALTACGQPDLPIRLDRDVAQHERKERMFERLFAALDQIGFLFGPNPDHLKYALRHMLGRADLSTNEVDILMGIAQQIRWYVRHHPERRDPPESP